MAKYDNTQFNPQIAALAMPDKSPLTEAGNAMMRGSDFIWTQKLNDIKARAGEMELKRAEQEYNKAEQLNPLEIASKQMSNKKSRLDLDEAAKNYAQNDLLRPLQLQEARAKTSQEIFKDATKEIKFNSELTKDKAQINQANAAASNYLANAKEQNLKNSLLSDDIAQNNLRLGTYADLDDLKKLGEEHKSTISSILNNEKLTPKQKYEIIRLQNGAFEKQRDSITANAKELSQIDWNKARANKANGGDDGLGIEIKSVKEVAKYSADFAPILQYMDKDIRDYNDSYVGEIQGQMANIADDNPTLNALSGGLMYSKNERAWRGNANAIKVLQKNLDGMGASFTASEQALIDGIMGGTNYSEKDFKERRKELYKMFENKIGGVLGAYSSAGLVDDPRLNTLKETYLGLKQRNKKLEELGWKGYQEYLRTGKDVTSPNVQMQEVYRRDNNQTIPSENKPIDLSKFKKQEIK